MDRLRNARQRRVSDRIADWALLVAILIFFAFCVAAYTGWLP